MRIEGLTPEHLKWLVLVLLAVMGYHHETLLGLV